MSEVAAAGLKSFVRWKLAATGTNASSFSGQITGGETGKQKEELDALIPTVFVSKITIRQSNQLDIVWMWKDT